MNNDNDYTIYCSRCGAEMKSSSRYCMKCGNLNYDHEANQNMKKIMGKEAEQQVYEVGEGNFIINNKNEEVRTSIATNTGNPFTCFLFTYSIFFVLFIGTAFIYLSNLNFQLTDFLSSGFFLVGFIYCVIFFYIYAFELIYIKCNKKWWSGFIPIYNIMVLSDAVFNNKWLGLVSLIPGVGFIYSFILLYKLGKDFSYNGFLTALLSFFYIPLIAFGTHTYKGYTFVSGDVNTSIEKNYGYKKIYLVTVFLFTLVCLVSFFYINKEMIMDVKNQKYYYVLAGKKMVEDVKSKIESNKMKCEFENPNSGVYYYVYPDVGERIYLPLYITKEPLSGYVKVDNSSGESKYYVTISDGTSGFFEVLDTDINNKSVVEYKNMDFSDILNSCKM